MKKYTLGILLLTFSLLFSQEKIRIGVWERFDAESLPADNIYVNTEEILNDIDDDHNGYIDDIHGIGFNEDERIISESFKATVDNSSFYNHGTAVSNLIIENCKNAELVGVGFEYTTYRLQKSGLLQLSVEERINQLPKEFERMKYFIDQSMIYFKKTKVRIVNISFGLTLEGLIDKNPNLGNNEEERKANALIWINNFKKYLEQAFSKYPKIIFVVAAGNEGKDINDSYDIPALINLPNVIVVGGLNSTLTNKSYFSNYGNNIDIWAPSENIKILLAQNLKGEESGVSLAAPYITARIASILLKNKKINKKNIKKYIENVKNKNVQAS